jgi:hypothetical protein
MLARQFDMMGFVPPIVTRQGDHPLQAGAHHPAPQRRGRRSGRRVPRQHGPSASGMAFTWPIRRRRSTMR